jgi:hypothetical protein
MNPGLGSGKLETTRGVAVHLPELGHPAMRGFSWNVMLELTLENKKKQGKQK